MRQITIEQAIEAALAHHRAGRLAEAEELLRGVLAQYPTHAGALDRLGVLACQTGRTEAAIELITRAAAADPAVAEYHHHLGIAYRRAGDWEQACVRFRRATELKPGMAIAHAHLGDVLRRTGRRCEAIDAYRRALQIEPHLAPIQRNLALCLHEAGRAEEAIAAYQHCLQLSPEDAATWSNLGALLQALDRPDEAIAAYQRALGLKPDEAVTHANLGAALRAAGRRDEALAACRRAVALAPDSAAAHNNLGVILKDQGWLDEALAAFARAVALKPDYAEAHNNRGNVLSAQERREQAIAAYERAIQLRPGYAEAHRNLGTALNNQGRSEEAVTAYRRAIALKPDCAESHNYLGTVLIEQGERAEAIDCFRRAIACSPAYADPHNNLGNALAEQGDLAGAIDAYRRAIALRPAYAEAHGNLGSALKDQGRLEEGIAALRAAVALKPDLAVSHNNLGIVLTAAGALDEAIASFRKALVRKPDFARAGSNLLFALHYHPDYDAQKILAEHRRWAEQYAAPLAAEIRPHPNDRTPDRRLRVGYVSPDFRDHPVGRLLLPLFSHHDRQKTEIVCYSDVRAGDAVTDQLRTLADHWHSAVGLSDPQLADLIRADRVDILADLALHTARNRLLVFARKPAPVQVSMLGMPATTGLAAMDYRLTDPYLDPPGASDSDYTEQSIRLPHCYWCYQPPLEAPPAGELPARRNGFITFGCLNQFTKINQRVLQLWARILQALPASRLVLLSHPGSHLDAARQTFQAAGIAGDRVAFAAPAGRGTYFERYTHLDLSLDPFPYNGHTSSLDSLWMGVPVITLAGGTAVGRGGVSILSNVGLPELIARTPEQYVARAVAWTGDLERLTALRAGLRQRMAASPLMDGKQYAADVEAAFRRMWKNWCGW